MLSIWTGVDPLSDKYPGISPYAYCGNNPVGAIDLRGDSITTIVNTPIKNPDGTQGIKATKYNYQINDDGSSGFYDSNGDLYSSTKENDFVNLLKRDLDNLRTRGSNGSGMVERMINSKKMF